MAAFEVVIPAEDWGLRANAFSARSSHVEPRALKPAQA